MASNYADIINRIADNLGKDNQSAVFTSIVKNDIVDALNKIYRKGEPVKKVVEFNITSADPVPEGSYNYEIVMPTDFFIPREVLFVTNQEQHFPVKELTYEEFLRWSPSVIESGSFNDLVETLNPATPVPLLMTKENFDLDGYVGFTFSDTFPQKLLWKPSINGKVKIYYSAYIDDFDIEDNTHIHDLFLSLIVIDVTLKYKIRQLSSPESDLNLYGLNRQISEYKEQYKEVLKDFLVYVNTNVSTTLIEPFELLNQ
jgi:hypothetical protein